MQPGQLSLRYIPLTCRRRQKVANSHFFAALQEERRGQARLLIALTGCMCGSAVGAQTAATEIAGAWARSASACSQIFQKRGDRVSFAKDARLHGIGFIVSGDRITGRVATCRIKWHEGKDRQLTAACSGYVVDSLNFTLKIIDENRIAHIVPGKPDLDIYQRCAF